MSASNQIMNIDGPGRYFVGLGASHIIFPGIFYLIEFSKFSPEGINLNYHLKKASSGSISCYTSEGQKFEIDLSIEIIFYRAKLINFYNNFGKNWEPFVIRTIIKSIKNSCSLYSALDIFSKIVKIQNQFITDIQNSLDILTTESINVQNLEITNIEISNSFDNKIEDTIKEILRNTVVQYNAQIKVIEAQILQIYQVGNNTVTTSRGSIESNAIQIKKTAESTYRLNIWRTEFQQIKSNLIGTGNPFDQAAFENNVYTLVPFFKALRKAGQSNKIIISDKDPNYDLIIQSL